MRWIKAWIAIGGLAIAAGSCGQEPIGVDVNLVNVGFTAQDGCGALVNSLAPRFNNAAGTCVAPR